MFLLLRDDRRGAVGVASHLAHDPLHHPLFPPARIRVHDDVPDGVRCVHAVRVHALVSRPRGEFLGGGAALARPPAARGTDVFTEAVQQMARGAEYVKIEICVAEHPVVHRGGAAGVVG